MATATGNTDEPFDDLTDEPFDDPAIVDDDMPTTETALARQSTNLVTRAHALQITDAASFDDASAVLQILKEKVRQIKDFFQADIDNAHAAWKGLTTKRASYVDPLQDAINALSTRYAKYELAERARADADRRQREDAARRADQDRLRAEAATRLADAERLQADAQRATSPDEAAILTQQSAMRAAEAEQLTIDAATTAGPVLPLERETTPPPNVSVGDNWTFRLDDLTQLQNAVAAAAVGTSLRHMTTADDKYLRAFARANRDTVRVPGVTFYNAGKVTHRRR